MSSRTNVNDHAVVGTAVLVLPLYHPVIVAKQVAELDRQNPELILEAELGPGKTERGNGLVDRAVGLGPEVVFRDARAAVEQAGRAVVALARRDRRAEVVGVRGHHMRPASRGSQRSASSVTLTSCSTTDSACSLTCWIIDPA